MVISRFDSRSFTNSVITRENAHEHPRTPQGAIHATGVASSRLLLDGLDGPNLVGERTDVRS